MPSPVLLAAYGTLMTGQENGLDPRVRSRMQAGRPCLIRGRLYEVRETEGDGRHATYPALVECRDDRAMVRGELLAIGAEAAIVLAALDRYEGYVPGDPDASTYLRRRRPVLADGVALQAWIYLYNRPTDGLRPIANGRWR